MAIEPSFEELIEEARPLNKPVRQLDDRTVMVDNKWQMGKKEFEGWIARERVRQALAKVGGI